jgi:hypothetical protein
MEFAKSTKYKGDRFIENTLALFLCQTKKEDGYEKEK